jgi:hypothetical protein
MSTDNKKISAYVPDVIYDRFVQFKDERDISMSQAAIEIFAAYFGINLNPTISNESTGELLGRVDTLEKELLGLKIHFKLLSERVDLMQSTSEPLITEPVEASIDKDINSEPDSSLQDELPKEDITEQPIDADIIDEPDSSLDSELLNETQDVNNSDLLSEVKTEPLFKLVSESVKTIPSLSGSVDELFKSLPIDIEFRSLKTSELAQRFKLSEAMVHKIKKFDINKQILYTSSKDPDKRSWVYLESAKLFYPLKISE